MDDLQVGKEEILFLKSYKKQTLILKQLIKEEKSCHLLKEYESKLIFNVDETGLTYRTLPEYTLMFKDKANSGCKKITGDSFLDLNYR